MPKKFSGSDGYASVYNVGDPGSIPGLGRSPGEGNGNPLQYSWKIPWTEEPGRLHGVAKSRTRLSDFTCRQENLPTKVAPLGEAEMMKNLKEF